jgi:hypothetical protein
MKRQIVPADSSEKTGFEQKPPITAALFAKLITPEAAAANDQKRRKEKIAFRSMGHS